MTLGTIDRSAIIPLGQPLVFVSRATGGNRHHLAPPTVSVGDPLLDLRLDLTHGVRTQPLPGRETATAL